MTLEVFMPRKSLLSFAVYFLGLCSFPSSLKASCGSAVCALDTYTDRRLSPGRLRVDLSFQYINQDIPRIGSNRAAIGELRNPHHDEIATINRLTTLRTDYELSPRWGLGISLPFVGRTHAHISNEEDSPGYNRWGFTGMGDFLTEIRYGILAPAGGISPRVILSVAGKFPTGQTNARNDQGELAEPTIQAGTGSYDFIGGVSFWSIIGHVKTLTKTSAPLPFFAGAKYRLNTRGISRYRIGNESLLHAGIAYPAFPQWELMAQADSRFKAKDNPGNTDEDVNFTGGDFVWMSPGLRVHITKDFSVYGYLQLPIYQRVNNEQLASARQALVGMTYTFGL